MRQFCLALCVLFQVATASASLVSLYEFNGNFSDTLGNSSDLVAFNNSISSFNSGAWTWGANSNPGGGLTLNVDSSMSSVYSIGLRFEFDNTGFDLTGRKIMDFEGMNAGYGLYFYNGGVLFYNETTPVGSITGDTFLDLIITRDASSVVTVYQDGSSTPLFSFTDTANKAAAVVNGSLAAFNFFHDDNNGAEWTPGGTVSELRVWNEALAAGSIPTAFDAVPEPSTWALFVMGFIGCLFAARRRFAGSK